MSNITLTCPFCRWNKAQRFSCEAGILTFPSARAKNNYVRRYCSRLDGWEKCTIAQALIIHYEEAEGE